MDDFWALRLKPPRVAMSDNPAADQAAYCRQRAAEARARAEAMTDFPCSSDINVAEGAEYPERLV